MATSGWLCISSTKKMVVKIVHPGGRIELHERPILAAEVMHRNPTSCVAYPHVFQQPWAIVAPETMLMPGKKFYVVPRRTIRKLQGLSPGLSFSRDDEIRSTQSTAVEEEDYGTNFGCNQFFTKKKNTSRHDSAKPGRFSDDICFTCLPYGSHIKENGSDSNQQRRKSISISSSHGGEVTAKTTDFKRNEIKPTLRRIPSPRRVPALSHWEPCLESVEEE